MGDFTYNAERIIQEAKQEARNRCNLVVDDPDILLSFLANAELYVLRPLSKRGITYSKVKDRIVPQYSCAKPEAHAHYNDMPWTTTAQSILNNAREINCLRLCGSEHLIAGLLKTPCQATQILSALGFDLDYKDFLAGFTVAKPATDQKQIRTHIRWMIRRDMPEVLAIESASFEFPWLEDDFICCLRQRPCIGMVAEHNDRVVGFMIYELNKNRIQVLNFATLPEMRRRGVGTQMVRKLVDKLSTQRRTRILIEVRETNLTAQLFFRSTGFRAISVLRDFYNSPSEDGYLMQYHHPEASEFCQEKFHLTDSAHQKKTAFSTINRISKFTDI